jgi:hypothetical protein
MVDDLEEVILALKAAGMATPNYKILPDGAYYFYNGQEDDHPPVYSPEPRGQID